MLWVGLFQSAEGLKRKTGFPKEEILLALEILPVSPVYLAW